MCASACPVCGMGACGVCVVSVDGSYGWVRVWLTRPVGRGARRRSEAIAHWSAVADGLPRVGDEPFHTALVEAMDRELDLQDRGPDRHRVPLEPVLVARYGAVVTGVVAYD